MKKPLFLVLRQYREQRQRQRNKHTLWSKVNFFQEQSNINGDRGGTSGVRNMDGGTHMNRDINRDIATIRNKDKHRDRCSIRNLARKPGSWTLCFYSRPASSPSPSTSQPEKVWGMKKGGKTCKTKSQPTICGDAKPSMHTSLKKRAPACWRIVIMSAELHQIDLRQAHKHMELSLSLSLVLSLSLFLFLFLSLPS